VRVEETVERPRRSILGYESADKEMYSEMLQEIVELGPKVIASFGFGSS
jgi:hypothetical protein